MDETGRAGGFDAEGFIDSHGERLLRSAFLLCGNEADAQDLVQETLVQAIRSWSRFRGQAAVYTWVHGILLNLCRRHHRRQKRLVYGETPGLDMAVEADCARAMDEDYSVASVTRALQQLSPEHREVLILRYFEEMKMREIARHAGVATGTIKSRLHHAVRRLEQLLPGELNLFKGIE